MAMIPKLGRVIAREDYKDGKHYGPSSGSIRRAIG